MRPSQPTQLRDRDERQQQQSSVSPAGTAVTAASAHSQPGPGMQVQAAFHNWSYFAKYTYTQETALLAYNFHAAITGLNFQDYFLPKHDPRRISATLAYIFYKYQVHHCDMALDLALALTYLEDLKPQELLEFEDQDVFNVIVFHVFLAHVYNADRTIRLSDWFKEAGFRYFRTVPDLNNFVFFIFSRMRRFKLSAPSSRVRKHVQRLCSVPPEIQALSSAPQGGPAPAA